MAEEEDRSASVQISSGVWKWAQKEEDMMKLENASRTNNNQPTNQLAVNQNCITKSERTKKGTHGGPCFSFFLSQSWNFFSLLDFYLPPFQKSKDFSQTLGVEGAKAVDVALEFCGCDG